MGQTSTVDRTKVGQSIQREYQVVASRWGKHRLLLAVLITVLGLLLVACESTSGDGEDVDAADDALAETADDEAAETDDEDASDEDSAEDDGDDPTSDEDSADDSGDDTASDEDVDQLVEILGYESLDEAEIPKLNVETLEAETPAETYQAEASDNAYVGEVTDDLFIGVSLDSQYTGQAGEISVYLCNEQGAVAYLTGELDDGSATLSVEGVEIELDVAEDEVSGTVTLAGEDEQPFSATPATGDAGMYTVTTPVDDTEAWASWIVLADGRQRGDFCMKTPFIDVFVCVSGAGGKISSK